QCPLRGGGLGALPPRSRDVAHDAPGPHSPPGRTRSRWSQPGTSGPSALPDPGKGWKKRPSMAAKIIPDSVRSDRVVITLGLGHRQHLLAQLGFQLQGDLGVFLQVGTCVLLSLADALAAIAVPGAGLVEELGLDAQFNQLALAADALPVQDLVCRLLLEKKNTTRCSTARSSRSTTTASRASRCCCDACRRPVTPGSRAPPGGARSISCCSACCRSRTRRWSRSPTSPAARRSRRWCASRASCTCRRRPTTVLPRWPPVPSSGS